jgi:hypothetical protein
MTRRLLSVACLGVLMAVIVWQFGVADDRKPSKQQPPAPRGTGGKGQGSGKGGGQGDSGRGSSGKSDSGKGDSGRGFGQLDSGKGGRGKAELDKVGLNKDLHDKLRRKQFPPEILDRLNNTSWDRRSLAARSDRELIQTIDDLWKVHQHLQEPKRPELASNSEKLSASSKDDLIRTILHLHNANENAHKQSSGQGKQVVQFIQVSGQPPPKVVALAHLPRKGEPARPGLPRSLTLERALSSVVILPKDPGEDSALTAGNGVLVGRSTILTARHVAEVVAARREKYLAYLVSQDLVEMFTPLTIVNIHYLPNDEQDPDLAVIQIKPVARNAFPTLAGSEPRVKDGLYVIGAQQFNRIPDTCVGFVATVPRRRKLDADGTYVRTVFGTNTFTFAGISGSPAYDPETGALVGIQTESGSKEASYKSGREALIKIDLPMEQWDQDTRWSWVVPIARYAEGIKGLIRAASEG